MTEKDAIIQLNFDMEMIRFNPETGENLTLEQIKERNEDNYNTYLADEMAITALIEIQSYRAIGTVQELQEMKSGDFTENLLNMGYTKGIKEGYAKAIDDALQTIRKEYHNFSGYDLEKMTKYGNETAEQQHESYSTLMMYEIADEFEDLIDTLEELKTTN